MNATTPASCELTINLFQVGRSGTAMLIVSLA
ncbi:hypothetical protein M3J09_003557 [Ascochyta lentis]